jgi:6-phosphogluconolactonase (cycloisomerase 2 family)
MATKIRHIGAILLWAGLAATVAGAGEIEQSQVIVDGSGGATLLDGARGVATSPDGRHVYATGTVDNGIVVFARDRSSGRLSFVAQYQNGIGGVQGLGGPADLAISSDGRHVYVPGGGVGTVAVFARSALTGLLTFVEFHQDGVLGVDGLGGARRAVVSSNGTHVYVAATGDGAVAIFARNTASGALTHLGLVRDGVAGVDGLAFVVDIVLSPDGAFLYAAGNTDDAVAIFARSAVTGLLTYLGLVRDGEGNVVDLQNPHRIAITPDARHLYAATADGVVVFSRNTGTGALTFVGSRPDLAPANLIAASRDGRLVFATSGSVANHRLSVLARDDVTGVLTPLEFRQSGVDGVVAIPECSLEASPDGRHLYGT